MLSFRMLPRVAAASSFSSSSLVQRPLRSVPLRAFASSSSSYPPSTANNKGNYAANQVPISTTANPEPNRASASAALASQTVKVSETLKDAYSGLKERVMSTAASVMDNSKTMMEKGKEVMEKGREVVGTGKEKMASMAENMNQKFEKLEEKFEQGGLGPVTGEDMSVTSGKFGSTFSSGVRDAAMGGENSAFERQQGFGVAMEENSETGHVSLRAVDSGASSSSASFSSSSSQPRSMSSGNMSSAEVQEEAPSDGNDVPQYGVMKPVDSASASSKRRVGGQSSDMAFGADRAAAQREGGLSEKDTATEHAAQAQRKQGMTSSELLGTDAIRGKNSERTAQAPTPSGRGASRPSQ